MARALLYDWKKFEKSLVCAKLNTVRVVWERVARRSGSNQFWCRNSYVHGRTCAVVLETKPSAKPKLSIRRGPRPGSFSIPNGIRDKFDRDDFGPFRGFRTDHMKPRNTERARSIDVNAYVSIQSQLIANSWSRNIAMKRIIMTGKKPGLCFSFLKPTRTGDAFN